MTTQITMKAKWKACRFRAHCFWHGRTAENGKGGNFKWKTDPESCNHRLWFGGARAFPGRAQGDIDPCSIFYVTKNHIVNPSAAPFLPFSFSLSFFLFFSFLFFSFLFFSFLFLFFFGCRVV